MPFAVPACFRQAKTSDVMVAYFFLGRFQFANRAHGLGIPCSHYPLRLSVSIDEHQPGAWAGLIHLQVSDFC